MPWLARSSSPSLGQDDDVGGLAAAQAIQQPERRREIGIDARAARRLISFGKAADRAHQRERREHANDVFHFADCTLVGRCANCYGAEYATVRLKRNDPPERRRPGGSGLLTGGPRRPGPNESERQAAAALAEVGTDAIVFRICEAIW